MEKIYYRIYELILFICSPKREPCKHVDFIILLRRLLYSENLNSPSAQTVSLSLYAMLTKFQKSAYCLQRFPFCTILYIYHYLIFYSTILFLMLLLHSVPQVPLHLRLQILRPTYWLYQVLQVQGRLPLLPMRRLCFLLLFQVFSCHTDICS